MLKRRKIEQPVAGTSMDGRVKVRSSFKNLSEQRWLFPELLSSPISAAHCGMMVNLFSTHSTLK
jgi:hypothetical protein